MLERPRRLLALARARYDQGGLEPQREEKSSLEGAVRWMARAMNAPLAPSVARRGARLLALKYGGATLAGALVGGVLYPLSPWLALAGFGAGFYAAEAQGVFLVPALLDGAAHPWRRSRALVSRAGGTLSVMATVLPLAAVMLTGPARAEGAEAAWCAGCLAVAQWYREVAS